MKGKKKISNLDIKPIVEAILKTIEKKRERDIIARRFGLFAKKETLEEIGKSLNVTRERVRQLETAIIANLKYNPRNKLPHLKKVEAVFSNLLKELGNVARIKDLGSRLSQINDQIHQSQILFLGHLSPKFVILKSDTQHHAAIGLSNIHGNQEDMKAHVSHIVKHITETGEPLSAQQIHLGLSKKYHHPQHIHALATISKKLAGLNRDWGLTHWPSVNPKNIRDKIYIVLRDAKNPLHFTEIAKAIHRSSFSRNQVTVQAIHNELIKDGRFILIGCGIYALKEWGYKKGTVADVIYEILSDSAKPLTRDEIVKQVLKQRQVKQTTILLNLQCKPIFKRLANGKYVLKL